MKMEFKHVTIESHPLRKEMWCVHNKTFPMIAPFVGSKTECLKAACAAELNAYKLIEKLKINKNTKI